MQDGAQHGVNGEQGWTVPTRLRRAWRHRIPATDGVQKHASDCRSNGTARLTGPTCNPVVRRVVRKGVRVGAVGPLREYDPPSQLVLLSSFENTQNPTPQLTAIGDIISKKRTDFTGRDVRKHAGVNGEMS